MHSLDRPTTAERYTRATNSSDLSVASRQRGDVDLLIAAGWAGDTLGVLLYRLRSEFDAEKGALEMARTEARRLRNDASSLAKRINYVTNAEDAAKLRDAIDVLQEKARTTAQTARLMSLINLKTLAETKQALGRFACIAATRKRFMRSDADVCKLVGRMLEAWLDPTCPHCHGVGYIGAYSAHSKPKPCPHCRDGQRSIVIGRDLAERTFAKFLGATIDRRLSHVDEQIRRYLH